MPANPPHNNKTSKPTPHPQILNMSVKQLFVFAAATTMASANLLRGTTTDPGKLELSCDSDPAPCIDPCLEMNLPFASSHCNDLELLSCVNHECTMSRIYVSKLIAESNKIGAPDVVPADQLPSADNTDTTATTTTATDPSEPADEKQDNTPVETSAEVPVSIEHEQEEKTSEKQDDTDQTSTENAAETEKLEKLEQLIKLKQDLGEEPTAGETSAMESLLKLRQLEQFESNDKEQAHETEAIYEKEENTIKMEDVEIATLQKSALNKNMLLGANSVLTGLE